ncbi:MAG: hypothetical protein H6Q72_3675 [Firmicutes bacterium]|nr:hypothetical protein [Bacillota bacterium]
MDNTIETFNSTQNGDCQLAGSFPETAVLKHSVGFYKNKNANKLHAEVKCKSAAEIRSEIKKIEEEIKNKNEQLKQKRKDLKVSEQEEMRTKNEQRGAILLRLLGGDVSEEELEKIVQKGIENYEVSGTGT